jgi:hypothetical protein
MKSPIPALIVQVIIAALLFTVSLISAQATGFLQQRPGTEQQASTDKESTLCRARVVFVHVRTDYMNREALERELLKRREFTEGGMTITRHREEADWVIEVTRKIFTTRFTISILSGRGGHVLASDSANSIGGAIEPKLADRFVKQLKKACSEKP